MTNRKYSDTRFTMQIKNLLAKTYGRSLLKDSLLEIAIEFYQSQELTLLKNEQLKNKITTLIGSTPKANDKTGEDLKDRIKKAEREQKDFGIDLRVARDNRHTKLLELAREIIHICEADEIDECNRKSAQVLGTIQLLSPTAGPKIAITNDQNKALYKSVLCLRLLDRLCLDKDIGEAHIIKYLPNITYEAYATIADDEPEIYQNFIDNVKVPLVMAALIQDIGNYHPEAQNILLGPNKDQDPYRVLDIENRKELLQTNYRETLKFLVEGIGPRSYVGNSKIGREKFNKIELNKLIFIKHLLKSSINPKNGIGNLLKIPQIYTSIILSTKGNYNYKLLPKVFQALNANAERGSCRQSVVDAFYRITGMYPQGYGVTYLPKDSDGKEAEDRYEYAVVTSLYPENPEQPICRSATRYLAFISRGQTLVIKKESNLYYAETAKKLSKISKQRLAEILELLASNYREREELDLIPRCWHSGEFFSAKENQKLWNRITE
jgi:hypothetical protein